RGTDGGVQESIARTFDNRTADWLISLPQTEAVTRIESASNASVTRTTDWTFDAYGRVQTVTLEKDNPDTTATEVATYGFDPFGLLRDVGRAGKNAPSQAVHFDYAPSFPGAPDERVFPNQVWASHSDAA